MNTRSQTRSPSPVYDHNDNSSLGMRPADPHAESFDSKLGFSQVVDTAVRFEDGNKMYVCHLCDFRTAFRNSLFNHQAVHSDLRPWVCAVCEYAAKRKQDLKKHLHTIHGLMVESTMLKPVGLPDTVSNSTFSRAESGEDSSWDDLKDNRISHMDSMQSTSHFFQVMPEHVQNISGTTLPATMDRLTMSIKKEKLEPASQVPLPSMSNFIGQSPQEQDYDLPVSFPSVTESKEIAASVSQSATSNSFETSSNSNRIPSSSSMDVNKAAKDFLTTVSHTKHASNSDSPLQNFSTPPRKRPRNYPVDSQTCLDTPQDHWVPPMTKYSKTGGDSDDLPCSSSVGINYARGSQTQMSFMCEFCDIMFFQRAMFLMHAGLHSSNNPWTCAVCGNCFTEKYSFTSHFINQH